MLTSMRRQHDLASHEAAVALSNAQAYLDEMVDLDNALVYGSPARGTRGLFHQTVTDYQRVLNLMDGCQTRWASAGRGQACSTFYNGALKTGTHAALVAGAQLIRDLWAQRVREGRRATLLSHDMLMLEEFDDLYLVNMLGTSEIVYEEVRASSTAARVRFDDAVPPLARGGGGILNDGCLHSECGGSHAASALDAVDGRRWLRLRQSLHIHHVLSPPDCWVEPRPGSCKVRVAVVAALSRPRL